MCLMGSQPLHLRLVCRSMTYSPGNFNTNFSVCMTSSCLQSAQFKSALNPWYFGHKLLPVNLDVFYKFTVVSVYSADRFPRPTLKLCTSIHPKLLPTEFHFLTTPPVHSFASLFCLICFASSLTEREGQHSFHTWKQSVPSLMTCQSEPQESVIIVFITL